MTAMFGSQRKHPPTPHCKNEGCQGSYTESQHSPYVTDDVPEPSRGI